MRRVFLMIAASAVFLTGCEKDEPFEPTKKNLLRADKGILCRGCGDWDKTDPGSEGNAARMASSDTDSTKVPALPVRPDKKK